MTSATWIYQCWAVDGVCRRRGRVVWIQNFRRLNVMIVRILPWACEWHRCNVNAVPTSTAWNITNAEYRQSTRERCGQCQMTNPFVVSNRFGREMHRHLYSVIYVAIGDLLVATSDLCVLRYIFREHMNYICSPLGTLYKQLGSMGRSTAPEKHKSNEVM